MDQYPEFYDCPGDKSIIKKVQLHTMIQFLDGLVVLGNKKNEGYWIKTCADLF